MSVPPNGSSSSGFPPGPPAGRPPMNGAIRPPGPPPGAPHGIPSQPPIQPGYPPHGFPPGPPPLMPNFPPPLPPGWSEHTAPDRVTKYYYNSNTRESTYTRPTFPGPFPAFPGASGPPGLAPSQPQGSQSKEKEKKKKEKPKQKVLIPGTTWQRITTTEGNVFYFEKENKRSEWTVPDEIKDAVEAFEEEERQAKEREKQEEEERIEAERLKRLKERERVRLEIEEERAKKRKAEAEGNEDGETKKVKKEEKQGGEAKEEEEDKYAPEDEEDEDAWRRAVAAEFAEADQKALEVDEEEREKVKEETEEAAKKVFSVPEKVNVSLEEGRALFKGLLIEKDISAFAPWDQSLPLFINDPRYILLNSMKDRKEVYEEYCRDVGRARRLGKNAPTTKAAPSTAVPEKKADPEREYKALMREDVTSTRTRWDDFRRKWKKDRRFYSFGRDDRDREKAFKTHLRELGERKRADAQRAEADFLELLKEQDGITADSLWTDIKKGISKDPRYDAVGSSSLREELYTGYVKKLASTSAIKETPEEAAERKLKERREKAEASLREREAKVREEKERVGKEVGKSKAGAGREEAERLFGSLLVDQIRDHEIQWKDAVRFLQADPRFNHPSLSPFDKQRLFNDHITRISSKRSNALHQLFAQHAPTLQTTFDDVYPKVIEDPIVKRLDLSIPQLEDRFNAWKRTQETEARKEFDVMLGENSFVEFWGKMRKKTLDEAAKEIKEDEEMEEGEGMGEGGAADLTAMGKQIDLEEIKSVLRRDRRYRQYDHIQEKREQWLRDYLENLDAASGSKTIHSVGNSR